MTPAMQLLSLHVASTCSFSMPAPHAPCPASHARTQGALYLRQYARALAMVASKAQRPAWTALLAQASPSCCVSAALLAWPDLCMPGSAATDAPPGHAPSLSPAITQHSAWTRRGERRAPSIPSFWPTLARPWRQPPLAWSWRRCATTMPRSSRRPCTSARFTRVRGVCGFGQLHVCLLPCSCAGSGTLAPPHPRPCLPSLPLLPQAWPPSCPALWSTWRSPRR